MIREDTGYDADMSTLVPFEHEKKEKRKPAREVGCLVNKHYWAQGTVVQSIPGPRC